MRELTATGLATFFMTEDSVRSYLKDKKLPKELVSGLLEGLTRKKEDFYGLLAKEVGRVMSKIDLSAELSRFLEKHDINLQAKLSFESKESAGSQTSSPSQSQNGPAGSSGPPETP